MPASPIRKLVPLANKAKAKGIKVYHLNIGQPDLPTPEIAMEAMRRIDRKVLEYSPSEGIRSFREKLVKYYAKFNIMVDVDDIIITTGGSEAVFFSFMACLDPGDEIIVSVAEHHANLVPWLMVAQQTGAKVVKLPLNAQRLPDVDLLPELITPRSRILALGQMSNVTGGCPDLARAITFAHSAGMVVMVDGAQGAVHFPADVQQLDIDFYAFSGHKLYGPTGIGVLYGKSELLEAMSPWLGGGKMIHEVSFDGFTTQSAPWKLEAGTPNVAGVIGLSAALEWLADYDINQAESWSRSLATLAEDALAKRPGFRSFRCQDSSLLAFDFAGVHHSDMVTLLAEYGIALRAGQHCAQPLLAELGVTGTLRASFAPYNTKSDVDALVNAVDRALELLVD